MDNPIFTSCHKVFRIKYHFVFVIKYRKDLFLNDKYVETVKNICKSLEERYTMKFETIGFDEDHLHFLLQSVPKYSPSQIFRLVKSITAIKLFEAHPDLKRNYGVESFGAMEVLLAPSEKELMQSSSENIFRIRVERENSLSCSILFSSS